MASIYDIDPNQLIEKAGEELKKLGLKKPIWSDFVKTGMHRERPPANQDWWYFRLAAVLRSVYKLGPIGTSKLRKKYGGRKNRGHKPDKVYRGSGAIIRKALQQLEEAGLIKKVEKGIHKGRIISTKGKSFLDKVASQLYKPQPKIKIETKKKEEKSKEEKKEIIKEETKEITKLEKKEIVEKLDNLPEEKTES